MTNYSIWGIIITAILISVVSYSMIAGLTQLAVDNSYSSDDIFDERFNDVSDIYNNLNEYENESENWEELSLGQGVVEYDAGSGFDILTPVKNIWNTIKSTIVTIVQIMRDVFHIPTFFTGILFGILTLLAILSFWKLWRVGY